MIAYPIGDPRGYLMPDAIRPRIPRSEPFVPPPFDLLHATSLTGAWLPRRPATIAASCKTSGKVEVDLSDLDSFGDGRHHLWCKVCYPEWADRPLGAELAVPFIAVCGARVVILAFWQSDDIPPGVCEICAEPGQPCATCGSL